MSRKQQFLVLRSETPQEMERQLNALSSTQKIGIINSNISEGTIVTTVALYETHPVPVVEPPAIDATLISAPQVDSTSDIATHDPSSSPLETHENRSCDIDDPSCECCQ